MLRTSLKNLRAHKLRLGLSFAAVVLSIAFVAGSLVFTDTLGKSFRDLFTQISPSVTLVPESEFVDPFATGTQTLVPQEAVDALAGVEGADVVEPGVSVAGVSIVGSDGEVVGTQGPPALGGDWSDTEGISPLRLVEGRAPSGADEVVIDDASAERGELAVGEPVTIVVPSGEPVRPTLVGIARSGETGNLGGATLTMWDRDSAQQLLLDGRGWTQVALRAAEGVTDEQLAERVLAAVGNGFEARTSAEQAEEAASEIEEGLSFLNVFLVVFAGISVFVGSFIIYNTFSMLVAQRTRELALLRAVGASRGQVTRSVLLEAVVVGLVGATAGLGLGVGLAVLLRALFGAIGLELGDTPFVFAPRTFAWAYAVGIGVTVVSAYFPARKASRVPPVAAMRDDVDMAPRGLRRRAVIGVLLLGAGVAAMGAGLAGSGSGGALLVGVSAVAVIVSAAVLSPVLSRPVVGGLAAGFPRLFGTVGRLARDNARRNPRRTAATASALMIGLALVSGLGTLAASTNASIDRLIDDALGADFVVSTTIGLPFSPEITEAVREVEGVGTVNVQRFAQARVGGQEVLVTATDPATLDAGVALDFTAGGPDGLAADGLAVDTATAEAQGLALGDEVAVDFATGTATLPVGAIYETNQVVGTHLVSLDAWEDAGGAPQDNFVYVDVPDDGDVAAVGRDLGAALAGYPNVSVKDQTEFKDEQRGFVDQILVIIYALLALSILIAVLGIINTLVLSVIERTREIGLLRAVGMRRSQLWRMVTLEAVVISVFGALLGLVVGVGFGVALQRALADQGITELAIPVGSLVGFLVAAAVVGVVAALWPARRATRIDVLRAITTE